MSKIALEGNASGTGTFTIAGPNTNTNYTITLPQETGTLVTTGVTTGLNGSAISTGVVAASVGGTGLTSAGTNGNVLTSNGTAWVSQAAAAGGGDYIMQVFTTPGTWTKPAGLKAIKVTVVGGGGSAGGINNTGQNGGGAGGGTAIEYIDAPAIPGPQPYTVAAGTSSPAAPAAGVTGNTSSFGSPAFCSATGGAGAAPPSNVRRAGGSGSGGTINIPGQESIIVSYPVGCGSVVFGTSGGSTFGFGTTAANPLTGGNPGASYGYGAGGMGTVAGPGAGQPGGPGVIIVEEFY